MSRSASGFTSENAWANRVLRVRISASDVTLQHSRPSNTLIWIFHLRVQAIKNYPEQRDENEDEHTAFGADAAPCEPARTAERWIQQVSGSGGSTVGDGIEKGLSPVERHVEANGPPKIASAAKGQAEEEPNECCGQRANPSFTRVAQMKPPESR